MNEPYSPATPRPMSSTSPSTMKMLMGFLAVFIVAQTIGTVLFCLYLHMKMDKMEEVLNLNEDYIFLRKDRGASKEQPKFEMQRGHEHEHPHSMRKNETPVAVEKRQPIAVHLAGQNSSRRVSVLEWKTTMYGPTSNNVISYQEGKLKVKEAGLYYIYSQVSFCSMEATLAPFTLYIYLHLPMEEDRLLLKGFDTHRTSTSSCEPQSIREGGVFELREGDMVFVNVTDSTRVNYKQGITYFGIFKL
ncbi:CD40 ligand [Amazona aestiva]|uniref:CD40 ligand n=1 Tax=Amazona aestiva TaxID=12930 RepID=A0A0Q3T445_AMAAE|nr:CD40 ligand [Amazona aestiva]